MPTTPPSHLEPELAQAYRECADRNVLAALNPAVFFGYFSVCADPTQGFGADATYPGLDWGQMADALLWLGRAAEVLASWEYVKTFLRADGLLPFAINPGQAGTTAVIDLPALGRTFPLVVDANGGIYTHWFPGNPLLVLANTTFLQVAEAIYEHTGDAGWVAGQAVVLRRVADWLVSRIRPDGLVPGGGYYLERPSRLECDGVTQCVVSDVLRRASKLLGEPSYASASERVAGAFRERFWAQDHCVEYIHPERGSVSSHGLTDVDWAAVATGVLTREREDLVWERLCALSGPRYDGMPTGIAELPETYEDWEMSFLDRHDLAAMGRVWFVEATARARRGDREGILDTLRLVVRKGREHGWSWLERYYSERTGPLASYRINTYCEYPANFIRIVHRFLPVG